MVALARALREESCNAMGDFKPRHYSVTHGQRSDSRASAATLSDCTRHTFTVMAACCPGNRLKDILPTISAEASNRYLYKTCDGYDDSKPLSRTARTSCERLSETKKLETQSAYFVCSPNRRLFAGSMPNEEGTTAVETSGRNARQQARQLDISATFATAGDTNRVHNDSPARSQIWWLRGKELEDASNPVRVCLANDRRDQQPPLFTHYCRHPKQSPAISSSSSLLCSSPPSFPSPATSIPSRSQHRVGVSPCTRPPLSPICRGGGSSPRIDGPI